VLAMVGILILWPAYNIEDRAAAIPAGSSREEVLSKLGKPFALMPIHGPGHEKVGEVWVYPGPLKIAPKFSFSPLRVSLFDRSGGPSIYFDTAGRTERVALPGVTN